jgi:hypothetical protein
VNREGATAEECAGCWWWGRDDSDADLEDLEDDSDSEGDKLTNMSHKQFEKDRRK